MSTYPAQVNGPHVPRPSVSVARLAAGALALALVSAGMWFAWLGWDHEYYLVDGIPQGPYRAWQVVGCALAVAVAAAVAQVLVRGAVSVVVLAAAATIGFAVPWSIDAGSVDDTGLWVVGLVMLLVGGGTTLSLLLALVEAVAGSRGRPRLPS